MKFPSGISFDLYDEVFGYSDYGHSSDAPKELAPINEQQQLTVSTSEQHKLIIPGPVKLQSPLLSLPNLECSAQQKHSDSDVEPESYQIQFSEATYSQFYPQERNPAKYINVIYEFCLTRQKHDV